MASPQSSREFSAGFPWRTLVISVVVFGLTLLIWAGMEFGYVPFLQSQIQKSDVELAALSQSVSESEQKELIEFYSQLYNIQSLIGGHLHPSRFFDFLEKSTHPMVKFSGLRLNIIGGEAVLEGAAPDFDTVASQLSAFKNDAQVASVALESSKRRDVKEGGGVLFSMKLMMQKNIFLGSRAF